MHARHYRAAIGRFLQPDPSAAEANLYGYAGENPVTRVDPSGLANFFCGDCGCLTINCVGVNLFARGILTVIRATAILPITKYSGLLVFKNLFTGREREKDIGGIRPPIPGTLTVLDFHRAKPGLYRIRLIAWWIAMGVWPIGGTCVAPPISTIAWLQ
jgi:hypothetical protein